MGLSFSDFLTSAVFCRDSFSPVCTLVEARIVERAHLPQGNIFDWTWITHMLALTFSQALNSVKGPQVLIITTTSMFSFALIFFAGSESPQRFWLIYDRCEGWPKKPSKFCGRFLKEAVETSIVPSAMKKSNRFGFSHRQDSPCCQEPR